LVETPFFVGILHRSRAFAMLRLWSFLRKRLLSFRWAFLGIADLLRHHPNAWVHLLAAIAVVSLGVLFGVSRIEWCLLVLCIAQVLALEALNSAVEYLADRISTEKHPLLGKAKDIAAGAVLLSAMGAAVVGVLIFGPYLWMWWQG